MSEAAGNNDQASRGGISSHRFLWIFASMVIVVALMVATVNLVAYRYMLRPENQAIVQLLSGWGRMYKPILYDEIKPEVAVFGASWARDAFDPIETGKLLGLKLFNHGVSGCTAYEARRFADSSLDNPRLKAAVVNLDSFYGFDLEARTRYGFDESILNVDAEGRPNPWVGLKRGYSLALTGWAAGANVELIQAILARDEGASRPEYLPAYEQADLTRRSRTMKKVRQRIFPQPGQARIRDEAPPPDHAVDGKSNELDWMIDEFCANNVDVYAYYTPTHSRGQACDLQAREKIAVLGFLRRKQAGCKAKIHYYDFDYSNAVTLEGLLSPVKASKYYRPDGHPRPTVGLLMSARMFGKDFPPETPQAVTRDFGVDLLTHPRPEDWLLERAARCEGDWGKNGYDDFVKSMTGS